MRENLRNKIEQISVTPDFSVDLPLCVDLDGSLVKTDTLYESILKFIKKHPFKSLILPFMVLKGKSRFKNWIASSVTINASSLPYNEELINFLNEQKEKGRRLILVSGAHESITQSIFDHLNIFDEHYGSNKDRNLTGFTKSKFLVERYGNQGFDYVGDSKSDIPVWRFAKNAVIVSKSYRFINKVKKASNVGLILPNTHTLNKIKAIIKAIRPHQWAKNLLLFVPMGLANAIDLTNLVLTAIAFVTFSLCASSVYLVNDLMDIESDRKHRSKKNRPIANGSLSIPLAVFTGFALLTASALLSLLMPLKFTFLLATYFALTLTYSFKLKQVAILDVMTLASLYTLRIFAGATAIAVHVSAWLMAFSVFFFLSLALIKRSSELLANKSVGKTSVSGRGYITRDINQLCSLGSSSGVASVLVLALYINTPIVRGTYEYHHLLWGLCPLLLYWISYCWMKTTRGEMHDDPVLFATRDKTSYIISGLFILVWILARGGLI